MSVRSFHSVFMAAAVTGAALGCYLVSLRVASERSALEQVEGQIALAQRDIRLLQTEIGTRARLSQLERWNVRVLSLSAPSADQILGDKFQLARMIAPVRPPALEAPVVLASAPAPSEQPVAPEGAVAPAGQLLHEAGLKVPDTRATAERKPPPAAEKPAGSGAVKAAEAKPATPKPIPAVQKSGDKPAGRASAAVTRPVRTAKVDPLAPLPVRDSTAKASRTDR